MGLASVACVVVRDLATRRVAPTITSMQLSAWGFLSLIPLAGVMLAILFGRRGNAQQHNEWEQVRGHLAVGIALGLTAALCQSLGAIIAKPVMMAGNVDAVSASGIRMGSAGCRT